MKTLQNIFSRTILVVGLSFLLAGFLPTNGQDTVVVYDGDIDSLFCLTLHYDSEGNQLPQCFMGTRSYEDCEHQWCEKDERYILLRICWICNRKEIIRNRGKNSR